MDPDTTYEEAVSAAVSLLVEIDGARRAKKIEEFAGELAERWQALDRWILRGGVLPKRWLNAGGWKPGEAR